MNTHLLTKIEELIRLVPWAYQMGQEHTLKKYTHWKGGQEFVSSVEMPLKTALGRIQPLPLASQQSLNKLMREIMEELRKEEVMTSTHYARVVLVQATKEKKIQVKYLKQAVRLCREDGEHALADQRQSELEKTMAELESLERSISILENREAEIKTKGVKQFTSELRRCRGKK